MIHRAMAGLYAPMEHIITDGLMFYAPFYREPGDFVDPFGHAVTKTGAICYADGAVFDGSDDKYDTGSEWIGTGARTIIAMIKPYTLGGNNVGRLIDNQKSMVYLSGNSYSPRLAFSSDGATTNAYSATGSLTLNQWQFGVITRTDAGVTNFFIGSLVTPPALSGTANQSSGTPVAGISNVVIGNRSAGDRAFCGMINDVLVYNRVLSLGEITAIWEALVKSGRYVQPFNLLSNGDMETGDPPTGWLLSGAGATWVRDGAVKYAGSYSGLLTRAGTNCEVGQLAASGYQTGRAYTFAVMGNCAVASRAYVQIWDGVGGTGGFCSGDGTWTRTVYTRTLATGANQLKPLMKVINGDTSAYFDNAILVQGDHI